MQILRLVAIDLDSEHGARHTSVIPPTIVTEHTAPEHELDAIIEEARRRARRRRRAYGLAAVVAIAVAGGLILGFGGGNDATRPVGPGGSGGPANELGHGIEMELPPGWHAAKRILTPALRSPTERVSVGTFRMRVGGECPLPVNAYADMGPRDGLITILERGPRHTGFPPRPARFAFDLRPGAYECALRNLDSQEFVFREAGRNFYAFVSLGHRAPRGEALAILNSFTAAGRG